MYDEKFFREIRDQSYRSATVVVPIALEYVRPSSVVDVGCGTGTWLRAVQENGVRGILGIDGAQVPRDLLEINADHFVERNLSQRFSVDRRFDLALCLEVAEQLPEKSATTLVESLTELAPVILFSAAVPFQGGTNHVNEQWPSYWVERFGKRGYQAIDCLRRRLWTHPDVAWWYAQNVMFFVRAEALDQYPRLRDENSREPAPLDVVHPSLYLSATSPYRKSVVQLVKQLPRAIVGAFGLRARPKPLP